MKLLTRTVDNGHGVETNLFIETGKPWNVPQICIGTDEDIEALQKALRNFLRKKQLQEKLYHEFKGKTDIETRLFFVSTIHEAITLPQAFDLFKKEKKVAKLTLAEFEILFNEYMKHLNATK